MIIYLLIDIAVNKFFVVRVLEKMLKSRFNAIFS